MGDGQECGRCRKSRKNCECKSPFRVLVYSRDGETTVDSTWCINKGEATNLLNWHMKQPDYLGGAIEKDIDGIGYVVAD
jgi:hypothetical protein